MIQLQQTRGTGLAIQNERSFKESSTRTVSILTTILGSLSGNGGIPGLKSNAINFKKKVLLAPNGKRRVFDRTESAKLYLALESTHQV